MIKLNQSQLKEIALISFVAITTFLYILTFRVNITSPSTSSYETEVIDYWENPIRVLVTGAMPHHFDHPYKVFDGGAKLNLLLGLVLSIMCIIGLVRKYLKNKEGLLKFGVYAYLWIYTAMFMLTIIRVVVYGIGEHAVVFWADFNYIKSIMEVLPVVLGFYGLRTFNPPGEEATLPQSGGPLRLFHGTIDTLLIIIGVEFFLALPRYILYYSINLQRDYMPDDTFYADLLKTGVIGLVASLYLAYLLFNRLLGTTPGKLITNAINDKPWDWKRSAANAAGRLIPFEPVSILGQKMWHDRISGVKVLYAGKEAQLVKLASFLRIALRVLVAIIILTILWGIYSALTTAHLEQDHYLFYVYLLYFAILMVQIAFISTLGELYRQTNQHTKWNKGILLSYIGLIPVAGILALAAIRSSAYRYVESTIQDQHFSRYYKFKAHLQNMVNQISFGLILIGIVWALTMVLEMSPREALSIRGLGGLAGTIFVLTGMANLSKGVLNHWNEVSEKQVEGSGENG